jgi:hypothetical protein
VPSATAVSSPLAGARPFVLVVLLAFLFALPAVLLLAFLRGLLFVLLLGFFVFSPWRVSAISLPFPASAPQTFAPAEGSLRQFLSGTTPTHCQNCPVIRRMPFPSVSPAHAPRGDGLK